MDIRPDRKVIKFAAFLLYSGYQRYTSFDELTEHEVISLISNHLPLEIAIDNISELHVSTSLHNFIQDGNIGVWEINANSLSDYVSIRQVDARRTGLGPKKLSPQSTAQYCALLAHEGIGIKKHLTNKQRSTRKGNGTLSNAIHAKSIGHQTTHKATRITLHEMLSNSFFVSSMVQPIGFGKEATVFLTLDRVGNPQIVKAFRYYSALARKIKSATHKVSASDVALKMAKQEARFLQYLQNFDLQIPRFQFHDGPMVGMSPILDEINETDNIILASQLSSVNVRKYDIDPAEMMFDILDQLHIMFFKAQYVHGDFSAHNLLFTGRGYSVIDFSQGKLVNFNTFTTSPLRMRMDDALAVLLNDIDKLVTFFERKYRLQVERDRIFTHFFNSVPIKFQSKIEFDALVANQTMNR